MIEITFLPQGQKVRCRAGTTISAAAEEAGLPLDLVCGGRGQCRKCSVLVEETGKKALETLACQEEVRAGITVHLPRALLKKGAVILTGGLLGRVRLSPAVEKVFLPAGELKGNSGNGDFEGLRSALGRPRLAPPALNALRCLSTRLRDPKGVTALIIREALAALEEGDTRHDFYGMAVDIGTTTVVAYLYNLNTGAKVATVSSLNKQVSMGADVMSRISGAVKEEGLGRLRALIMETLGDLFREASERGGISTRRIYLVTLVGNTTMHHLFCGLSPHYLGRFPFAPAILETLWLPAPEVPVEINPAGYFVFLPLIGGFVGADITGVLLASNLRKSRKLRLVIDIGTNGEIVLGCREEMLACSTAAGPALEGAGITFGMRGTGGAVEDVAFDSRGVSLKVIGGKNPAGICGSGLVACLAEMLKVGMVKQSGRLLSREEFTSAGGSIRLAERLEEVEGQRVFRLVPDGIYLSQADIRAVQLAKGAISTGVALLLKEMGASWRDLKEILLAGAFGNYIDVSKGQAMGLIPHFPGVPVRPVGNAAGAGAQKALLSRQALAEASRISTDVRHVELAGHPCFQDRFIDALMFPPSGLST